MIPKYLEIKTDDGDTVVVVRVGKKGFKATSQHGRYANEVAVLRIVREMIVKRYHKERGKTLLFKERVVYDHEDD